MLIKMNRCLYAYLLYFIIFRIFRTIHIRLYAPHGNSWCKVQRPRIIRLPPAVEGAGSDSSLVAFHCCSGGVHVQAPFPVSWPKPQFLDFAQIGMECKSMQIWDGLKGIQKASKAILSAIHRLWHVRPNQLGRFQATTVLAHWWTHWWPGCKPALAYRATYWHTVV